MTFEEKLEIVSKNYADKYIEDVDVESIVHKAYCEGFKVGYKKSNSPVPSANPQLMAKG